MGHGLLERILDIAEFIVPIVTSTIAISSCMRLVINIGRCGQVGIHPRSSMLRRLSLDKGQELVIVLGLRLKLRHYSLRFHFISHIDRLLQTHSLLLLLMMVQ